MENKIDKEKLLADFNEKFNELSEFNEVEEMIQDNTIEFEFSGEDYRIRKLNRREKHEIRKVQSQEKNRLVSEKGNATEEELIQMYLNRDNRINIPELRQEIKNIQVSIDRLAVTFTECNIDSEKKKLEAQCTEFQSKQLEIISKIDECLNSSIEKQLKSFVQEYMIYLVLEKRVGDNWERHYKSYDAFMNTTDDKEDKLLYKATWYFAVLINKNE